VVGERKIGEIAHVPRFLTNLEERNEREKKRKRDKIRGQAPLTSPPFSLPFPCKPKTKQQQNSLSLSLSLLSPHLYVPVYEKGREHLLYIYIL
jgi:hypothetical protein